MYFSYRDCWQYAFYCFLRTEDCFKKNCFLWKKDLIILCDVSPEVFWKKFEDSSLTMVVFFKICLDLNNYFYSFFPVSLIKKEVFFFGLSFAVCPGVFVPQVETETVVQVVLQTASRLKKKQIRVLELGTGCGNIAISLFKTNPNWKITATDISNLALKIAKKNAFQHQAKVNFIYSNLFDNLSSQEVFDIIVFNPPYISFLDYKNLSFFTKKQPFFSLCASNNGTFFYSQVLKESSFFLAKKVFFVFEISPQNKKKILKHLKKLHFKKKEVEVFLDFSGNPRVLVVKKEEK